MECGTRFCTLLSVFMGRGSDPIPPKTEIEFRNETIFYIVKQDDAEKKVILPVNLNAHWDPFIRWFPTMEKIFGI